MANGKYQQGIESYEQDIAPKTPDQSFLDKFNKEIESHGGELKEDPVYIGSAGRTMFDLPNSKDNLISVLLPKESVQLIPSQTLVTIGHPDYNDGRIYQGIVVQGPFYEPDGLRGDAPLIVTTAAHGAMFMPEYHGRVEVEIIGEIVGDIVLPPRYRPSPNSPVQVLGDKETVDALKISGDVTLGVAIGHDDMEVKFPSDKKSILPRHTAILGTTGAGKSTTVGNQVNEYQQAGLATILIDTEGEYTCINNPSDNLPMIKALQQRGKEPQGVEQTKVYHLVGREPSNPNHPNLEAFSLRFDQLSPDTVMDILEITPAQQECYLKAYEIARKLIVGFGIYGSDNAEKKVILELDETEEAFPRLQLSMMYDIVHTCQMIVSKNRDDDDKPNVNGIHTKKFRENKSRFFEEVERAQPQGDKRSWRRVQGRLGELLRLKIFDNPSAKPLNYDALTQPKQISIIDLGDTDSPRINNLVIAELLESIPFLVEIMT